MLQTTTRRRFDGRIFRALLILAAAVLLIAWLSQTPGGLLGKADAIGYAVCHRIDARSFHIHDRALPLCARCSGMYLAALTGILVGLLRGRRSGMPPWRVAVFLAIFALSFAADGVNSYLHFFPQAPSLYQPQNWLRLVTGAAAGIAISGVLVPAFHQTIWRDWDPRPALPNLAALAELTGIVALVVLLVLTGSPLILYLLALASAAGVLVMLGLLYTMIWVMIFRADNRFSRWRDLAFPLLGGFTTALLQIAVIDLGRFLWTGTWGGFPL